VRHDVRDQQQRRQRGVEQVAALDHADAFVQEADQRDPEQDREGENRVDAEFLQVVSVELPHRKCSR
jgi:hypothetical protein